MTAEGADGALRGPRPPLGEAQEDSSMAAKVLLRQASSLSYLGDPQHDMKRLKGPM